MGERMNCPKCDADISDTYEPDDYSCGISEGWFCDACDLAVAGWEHPREPMEGDVAIPTAREVSGDRDPGIPGDHVSGRWVPDNHPDRWKYDNFVRIAKSWGFD